ncbi:Low copy number virion structural protein [Sporosarcina soli]|uniref:Low copy number virion structural protein n=1 Tax=Sporosarcina soli TaxID=334736 RepID=A0ABW0TDZ2_9BACL
MGGGFNVNYTAGGRLDAPFYPSKPNPFIKGFILEVGETTTQKEYTLEQDAEFLGIAFAMSEYYTHDNITVKVNEKNILETVYTKDLPEGIFFTTLIPLKAGDSITFIFNNISQNPKDVWYNYQFLIDEE